MIDKVDWKVFRWFRRVWRSIGKGLTIRLYVSEVEGKRGKKSLARRGSGESEGRRYREFEWN